MIDNAISEVDNSNVGRSKQGQKKLHYGELEGITECITLQTTCRNDRQRYNNQVELYVM